MGGAQAGELASLLAANALKERPDREPGGEAQVVELVQEANRRVHQRALDDAAASGMGTTMTVALFGEDDGSVTIGHVGDSRAYSCATAASSSSRTTTRWSRSWSGAASSRRPRPRCTRSAP